MANFFGKTLLSFVAACVAHGVTPAQDVQETFKEAVRLIRINKPEEGLEKLRAVLAADPSHEVAFETWKSTDIYIWQMLLEQGGDYEVVAKMLMDRATLARKEMARDEDAIAALIEKTRAPDFATRSAANAALASDYAEFAVPQLVRILGDTDADAEQDFAMLTLIHIGRPAALPLIEALKSDNDLLRRNAAAVLVEIGDTRATAPLAQLANDPSAGVRQVAASAMQKLGVAAGTDPASLYLRDAQAYMAGVGVGQGEASDVVWTWDPSVRNVVAHDVPSALYTYELAKMRAQDAMRIDPANQQAQDLLAAAYVAQAQSIEDNALDGNPARLRMVAAALGEEAMVRATEEASMPREVLDALILELGRYEGGDMIRGETLVNALGAEDAGTRYAAALALTQRAETAPSSLQAPAKVIDVLGGAVTEEAKRAVLVVDGNPLTQKAVRDASSARGFVIREAGTAKDGIARFYAFPVYDVVVVSETLDDPSPEIVVSLIRQRSPETKILLLAQSEDAESRFDGLVDGFIQPEDHVTSAELLAGIGEVAEAFEPRRERADNVAVAAGQALVRLAAFEFDISPVADHLAAQLDRQPRVAIPAATALGSAGKLDHAGALVSVASNENADIGLRVAAANAIGGILGRSDRVPMDVLGALMGIATDESLDLDLRAAAAGALGRGKLDAGTRLQLAEVLKSIPQIDG